MTNPATDHAMDHRTIGEIAATVPGATAVFRNYKLDFCCGGEVALADAAAKRGVDLGEVTHALASLEGIDHDMLPESTSDLIDHIVTRFHETHRRELPELYRLARKVESVHATHPSAPAGLADILADMLNDLESHMAKEEAVLFPLFRRGGHPSIMHPVAQMRREHDTHGQHLQQIEQLTHNFTPPAEACRSWQALYVGLAKLTDDLMQHIHIENNVLFPRFDQMQPLVAEHSSCCGCCGG
ncbi:iron-sulfur cluster repair protein YtfE [Dongia sp.]|uniref:iron-sulfur cluster repair protein YtfE n=1 Tax=Dongia sp. TaxID=1977262 RepID=UPI0035B2360A